MTKVYTLLIENYDALDGYMTSIDVKVFADKAACETWIEQEARHQAQQGFETTTFGRDIDYWQFDKETDRGTYRHEFYGQYRDVIKEVE